MTVRLLEGRLAVCRLSPGQPPPAWDAAAPLFSITRAGGVLSVVCSEDAAPEAAPCERGWRALEVAGPLDFSLIGILASLAAPLAEAGVSIFAISTYDTDYVLVKEDRLAAAVRALEAAGHSVERAPALP